MPIAAAGRAVETAVAILRSRAHFDAGDVADADSRTVGIGAQDNGGEFLGPRQAALGLDIDLDLLLARCRRRADTPERRLNVLVLHRQNDVVRRQVELGQPVRIEPDPQRIIERPEQRDLADAVDPRQRVDDVDGRVIAQIDGVVGVLRRVDIDDLKQRRGFLADRQAGMRHLVGELRRGEARAILHIDGVDVRIGAQREGHVQRVAAVRAAGRLVVDRVVDAVDLLLDGLGDRGLDRFGVGAGIIRGQRDLRRHDFGKLRDRDRRDGDRAGERDHDGDDDGKSRPVDENAGEHRCQFSGTTVAATTWPGCTF